MDVGEEETPSTACGKKTKDTINKCAVIGSEEVVDEEVGGSSSKKKKLTDFIQGSYKALIDQSMDVCMVADIFIFKYGYEDDNAILWTILLDSQ